MSTIEPKDVVMQFLELGGRGEIERAMELMSDDVTWTNIGSTRFSGRFSGKQRLLEDLLGPLFDALESGIDSTIERVVAEGDTVVVLSRGRARTRDGRPYENSYAQVFTLDGGRIAAVTEYMDTALIDATFGPAD